MNITTITLQIRAHHYTGENSLIRYLNTSGYKNHTVNLEGSFFMLSKTLFLNNRVFFPLKYLYPPSFTYQDLSITFLKFCLHSEEQTHFFLWQRFSSCKSKFLLVIGNVFFLDVLWDKNVFMWQDFSSCDKSLLVIGNFVFWWEISSWSGNFSLWQKISSSCWKFLPERRNFFLWHEVSYLKFLFREGNFCNISS